MPFTQCADCAKFYNVAKPHACATKPPEPKAERAKPTWPREWYRATPADARIARKFKNCVTAEMF